MWHERFKDMTWHKLKDTTYGTQSKAIIHGTQFRYATCGTWCKDMTYGTRFKDMTYGTNGLNIWKMAHSLKMRHVARKI